MTEKFPYPIFFISNGELNAQEHYDRLCECLATHIQGLGAWPRGPSIQRVDGARSIHSAHKTCAIMAEAMGANHFYTVDADNWVYSEAAFMPRIEPEPDSVYVWRCKNAVNGLVYGYGAIKLFPTLYMTGIATNTVDMTTSVSANYRIINELASETRFNTSDFEAWKSGFREACKLASGIIDRQNDDESAYRLQVWVTEGLDKPFGGECILGARQGSAYGREHAGDREKLALINDWGWLRSRFSRRYEASDGAR